jgi:type I restriction enzyme S subunit
MQRGGDTGIVTMAAWQTVALGDALTFQRGFDITKTEQRDGPYPVISSSGPKTNHSEFKVRGPGVIIGRKGSLGTVFYSERDYWPHDTTLWIKDFHGNHPRFAYYFLQTMGFERLDAGASNPSLNRNHIHTIPVRWPPLQVQRHIASILSAYDELIENSQRRIKILEDMARSLYREWFVHFCFPGHESVPRVPTPLGDIPQGWEVSTLQAVTTKIGSGATPRGGKDAYKTEGIHLIRSLNIYDYNFKYADLALIDEKQAAGLASVTIEENDILLNITGASVGRCTLVPTHLLPARVNQHVAIVRSDPTKASPFYILDSINSEQRKQQLLALAQGGATREALTKDTVSNFQIVLPPQPLMQSYHGVARDIHKQREALQRKIQNLRRTRDLLLPRLLSGQVELKLEAA